MQNCLHICTVLEYNRGMNTKPLGVYIHTLITRRGLKIGDVQVAAGVAPNYLLRLRKNQAGEPILANLNALIDAVGGNRDHIQRLLRDGATEEEAWTLAQYAFEYNAADVQSLSEDDLRREVAEFEQAARRDNGLLKAWRSLRSAWEHRDGS